MLVTENSPESSTMFAGSTKAIRVRIPGQAAEQLVNLPWGKLTIGSSPRCNIRIQEPGVHPVHSLIVHDAEGLTARRWAGDTLLNGESFDEAPLAVGDHLSLGPVDLEIVEGTRSSDSDEPATWDNTTVHHTTVWLDDDVPPLPGPQPGESTPVAEVFPAEAAREVFRQLKTANALSRERSRRLLDALRATRDAYRCVAARVEELEEQLRGVTASRDTVRRCDWKVTEANHYPAAWDDAADGGEESRTEIEVAKLTSELAEKHAAEVAQLTAQIQELTAAQVESSAANNAYASELQMLRQQLETAQERYADWDHKLHEWEKERAGWDAERTRWESQRTEWTNQQHVWQQEQNEWIARLAEHVRRIDELERQLADVQQVEAPEHRVPPTETAADSPSVAPPATPETCHWQSDESEVRADSASAHESEPASTSIVTDQTAAVADSDNFDGDNDLGDFTDFFDSQEGARQQGPLPNENAAAAEHAAGEGVFEEHSESPTWDGQHPTWDEAIPSWAETAPAESNSSREEAGSHADSSVAIPLNADPESPPATQAGAATVKTAEASSAADKRQSTSFIERFAHLFTDEGETAGDTQPVVPRPAATDSIVGKPRNSPIIRQEGSSPRAAKIDEEESVEEYMAKLMQRMRGDRPAISTLQPAAAARESSGPAADLTESLAQRPAVAVIRENDSTPLNDLSEMVRRNPAAERPTNLDALRALANETARRAIGVHDTKTHRRQAVTKFLVASLAGITSMWLMMLAPDWRDLQFITACVSLLIAAYWAGQMYGALLEMARAGEYDGPGSEFDAVSNSVNARLPIDVCEGIESQRSTVESQNVLALDS